MSREKFNINQRVTESDFEEMAKVSNEIERHLFVVINLIDLFPKWSVYWRKHMVTQNAIQLQLQDRA